MIAVTFNPETVNQYSKAFGLKIDSEVFVLEGYIMDKFKVDITTLKDWRYDTPEKITLCFLLHHIHRYSLASLATRYGIYKHSLRLKIEQIYTAIDNDEEMRNELQNIVGSVTDNNIVFQV